MTPQEIAAKVGEHFATSEWVEMSQERINQFADATDDHQWIHVDPARAATGPFGACIAHGYLTLALVNRFLPELIRGDNLKMGVNVGCDRIRFPAPVRVGSRIRGRGEVLKVERIGEAVQSTVRVSIEIRPAEEN